MAILETNFVNEIRGKSGAVPSLIEEIKIDDFELITTKIQFFLDGNPVSEFVFNEDETFTLENRPNPVIGASRQSIDDTVNDINKWVEYIQKKTEFAGISTIKIY